MTDNTEKTGKDTAGKPEKQKKSKPEKVRWYEIGTVEDAEDTWDEDRNQIVSTALEMGLKAGTLYDQEARLVYVYCTLTEVNSLIDVLGEEKYFCREAEKSILRQVRKKNMIYYQSSTEEPSTEEPSTEEPSTEEPSSEESSAEETGESEDVEKPEKKKKIKLGDQLTIAIANYNATYSTLNDHGTRLFNQRERAMDLLGNVEYLISNVANHPKEFDAEIAEIKVKKEDFKDACKFAEDELASARKSAAGIGAGIAGGVAVASLGPSAAMWIATTFGTASTGTAISTLSGAAATNAALAWLGGGTLAVGGGGMAAGQAFLALAGPVGWGIAGVSVLTSIVLFAKNKIRTNKAKKEEIEAVLRNTEQLKEADAKVENLRIRTSC